MNLKISNLVNVQGSFTNFSQSDKESTLKSLWGPQRWLAVNKISIKLQLPGKTCLIFQLTLKIIYIVFEY